MFHYSTSYDKQHDLPLAIQNLTLVWKLLFKLAINDPNDMIIEIDQSVFRSSESEITKLLLYIHSMETFIPESINLGSAGRDQSKVSTLGPYALALGCILDKAEVSRRDSLHNKK